VCRVERVESPDHGLHTPVRLRRGKGVKHEVQSDQSEEGPRVRKENRHTATGEDPSGLGTFTRDNGRRASGKEKRSYEQSHRRTNRNHQKGLKLNKRGPRRNLIKNNTEAMEIRGDGSPGNSMG